ncbi:MAG: class II aldolase/adducin family protein, partial [Rhodospirillales bacterium]
GILPISQQALSIYAHTAYHEYEGLAFDLTERERLVSDLGDNRVMVLRNHGLLTVGKTIGEAFMWMYRAERACRYQLSFQQSGAKLTPIPQEVIDKTVEQGKIANSPNGHRPIGQKEWPALLRKLDRANPGYDA